jgi:NAD(P)H-dependent glutamate synthase small subunit
MHFPRVEIAHRPVEERVHDWREVDVPLPLPILQQQASRCMDCAIPYCHGTGCPVKNRIPEFNDLAYRNRWREALENLHSTNNFPEITGRVCPAPCEAACTLAINDRPVNIKHIEYQISERGWREGWVRPLRAPQKTGKRVAVIGSGPAGLAAAQQLVRAGHDVVLFEKDDRIGGLLRYGIPDFKLEKPILDRRIQQMAAEGVRFEPGVEVGRQVTAEQLKRDFHAICLCMGAGQPRTLDVPGAGAANVRLAMDYLTQQNRRIANDRVPADGPEAIHARDKHVVVLGGGDTGSDCVGTAIRQGAKVVWQLEILPKPPAGHNADTPWPLWPRVLRTSSSQEEGCERRWGVHTKRLDGINGSIDTLHGVEVEWHQEGGAWKTREVPGSEFTMRADLVLLAMGFVHVVHAGIVEQFGLKLDARGNVSVHRYMTSHSGVFAAGDTMMGASLVVHAINHGRLAAAAIDKWLGSAVASG